MNRIKNKSIKNNDKIIEVLKTIVLSLATGLLGFAAGWLFEGKIVLSVIVFSVLAVFGAAIWIFTVIYEKKVSIIEMLNDNIRQGKYREAVKLGYSVSRTLFLSGRYIERYRISEKVCQALDNIDGAVVVNGAEENADFLRAKILIDDCGWSLYLVDRFSYKKSAESKVKEGINECLRLADTFDDKDKIFSIVFVGIRHLFGMSVENFEKEEKETLTKNDVLVSDYISNIEMYGGILGLLLDDKRMYAFEKQEDYLKTFDDITLHARNSRKFFVDLKEWCLTSLKKDKFIQSTYNFRSKFFFVLYKAYIFNNQPKNNFLEYAKETALLMTLGYSRCEEDCKLLSKTSLYAPEIEKYHKYKFSFPDRERLVKGMLLLGKVAMAHETELQSLEDAKKIFVKTSAASKDINRIDTYVSSQKNRIALNERLFNLKLSLNYLSDIEAYEELHRISEEMQTISRETKQYVGYLDDEMRKSCRKRARKYREMMKKIKQQNKKHKARY